MLELQLIYPGDQVRISRLEVVSGATIKARLEGVISGDGTSITVTYLEVGV